MTPEQITLVQDSWLQVFPLRETAAPMFYDELFELEPALRPLFKADLSQQAAKLFETLNAVVASLEGSDTPPGPASSALDDIAQPLRRSHAGYGATPAHYEAVCSALMWTLQASMGHAFTAPVRAAWQSAYAALAQAMQGSRPARNA